MAKYYSRHEKEGSENLEFPESEEAFRFTCILTLSMAVIMVMAMIILAISTHLFHKFLTKI